MKYVSVSKKYILFLLNENDFKANVPIMKVCKNRNNYANSIWFHLNNERIEYYFFYIFETINVIPCFIM